MNTKLKNRLLSVLISLIVSFSQFFNANAYPYFPQEELPHDVSSAIRDAFGYISTQMNDDGGIRWVGEESSLPATLRIVWALSASGYPQEHLTSASGNHPIDFLRSNSSDWILQSDQEEANFNVARAGQVLVGIAAADENPRSFGSPNLDLVYEINRFFDPNIGIYGNASPESVLDQVWAILGLAANHYSIPLAASQFLVDSQLDDGSWNDGYDSYLDTTPLALLALLASGYHTPDSPAVQSGIAFIHDQQTDLGGWQTLWDTTTNPITTGVILQALAAIEEDPADERWQKPAGNPQSALLNLQQENGVIGAEFANAFSTAEAVIGLSGQPLYQFGFVRNINLAFRYLFNEQESSGGWQGVGQTIDVIMAIRNGGWDPATAQKDNLSPLDAISESLQDYLMWGPDAVGKTIIGVSAAGMDTTNFGGINLIDQLMTFFDEANAAFGDANNTWHQSLAILGLFTAGKEIPLNVVETLQNLQQEDGGWEYSTGMGSWPDNTALALQALKAGGFDENDPAIQDGFAYIKSMQQADGGWGVSSTTAYVIMAINAFGHPYSSWLSENGKTPLSALFAYQKLNGAFFYNNEFADENLMSTAAGVTAALGGHYLERYNDQEAGQYAGIIVDPGDGSPQAACVELSDTSMTGFDLIHDSGFLYDNQNGFINSINGISNPAGETNYWSYWQWGGREWQFMEVGAGDSTVLPGSIDAWFFTSWEIYPSLPPVVIPNLDSICDKILLKNVTSQPYLNYNDLFGTYEAAGWLPILTEPDDLPIAVETPQSSPTPAPTVQIESTPAPIRSNLPFFLIGGIGLLLLVIVIVVVYKRRK